MSNERKGTETAAHVLLMTDDPELLETMQLVLEEEGYRATPLAQALTDMRKLAEYAPNLVILDWLFGSEARGLQVVQAIRLTPDLKNLPIIVCSAAIREMADYFATQEITVLLKPFDLDNFLAAIARSLEQGDLPHPE